MAKFALVKGGVLKLIITEKNQEEAEKKAKSLEKALGFEIKVAPVMEEGEESLV
jgi:hypothetical protein